MRSLSLPVTQYSLQLLGSVPVLLSGLAHYKATTLRHLVDCYTRILRWPGSSLRGRLKFLGSYGSVGSSGSKGMSVGGLGVVNKGRKTGESMAQEPSKKQLPAPFVELSPGHRGRKRLCIFEAEDGLQCVLLRLALCSMLEAI